MNHLYTIKNSTCLALAGIAQWIECGPGNPRVLVRFPVGHMPGLWARSPVGATWEATTHWSFSPFLPPSHPLTLKINNWKIVLPASRYVESWLHQQDINQWFYLFLYKELTMVSKYEGQLQNVCSLEEEGQPCIGWIMTQFMTSGQYSFSKQFAYCPLP